MLSVVGVTVRFFLFWCSTQNQNKVCGVPESRSLSDLSLYGGKGVKFLIIFLVNK